MWPTSPVTLSTSGCTLGCICSLANGCGSSGIMRPTSALAWASVTPGFNRARTWKSNSMKPALARSTCIGSRSAGVFLLRNLKEAGSTPMISAGTPSIESDCPTTWASPPNRRCQ